MVCSNRNERLKSKLNCWTVKVWVIFDKDQNFKKLTDITSATQLRIFPFNSHSRNFFRGRMISCVSECLND